MNAYAQQYEIDLNTAYAVARGKRGVGFEILVSDPLSLLSLFRCSRPRTIGFLTYLSLVEHQPVCAPAMAASAETASRQLNFLMQAFV